MQSVYTSGNLWRNLAHGLPLPTEFWRAKSTSQPGISQYQGTKHSRRRKGLRAPVGLMVVNRHFIYGSPTPLLDITAARFSEYVITWAMGIVKGRKNLLRTIGWGGGRRPLFTARLEGCSAQVKSPQPSLVSVPAFSAFPIHQLSFAMKYRRRSTRVSASTAATNAGKKEGDASSSTRSLDAAATQIQAFARVIRAQKRYIRSTLRYEGLNTFVALPDKY